MRCPYCNAELPDNAQGCTYCGNWFGQRGPGNGQAANYQQPPNYQGGRYQQGGYPGQQQGYGYPPIMPVGNQTCGKATASLILSLVGIIIAGLICGILGIVFGVMALNEIREKPYLQGKGLAIAGLSISIIDCFLMIIYIAVLFA